MSDNNARVWFITGSSTGFGRSLVEAVLKHGDRVVATARKPEQLDDLIRQHPEAVKAVSLDVTDPNAVQAAVKAALDAFGRVDVLVNNAGYGAVGAIEEVSDEAIHRQFDTNVFGALNVTRALLPTLRQQRSGHILNLSSVGGLVSFPGSGIYCATKFALEAISEALAKEVEALGIKVTIVEPGAFRTDFNGRSLAAPETFIDDYASISGAMLQWLKDMDGKQPGDPDKAAAAMIQVVESDKPPLRLALGADAVGAIDAKLESVKAELDAWKQVSIDTAFEGAVIGTIGG
ncbi:MAG: SDR family NAD(P)-dependent oxidoreductase [Tildeniella nuda ZEHNDER 1965/U140]|nr:SDR family NAD(P)-dependent oxidoreductase [Tildeniella nuda ZEHNDER 1965/U140]